MVATNQTVMVCCAINGDNPPAVVYFVRMYLRNSKLGNSFMLAPDDITVFFIVYQAITSKRAGFFLQWMGHYMTNGLKHKVFDSPPSTSLDHHWTKIIDSRFYRFSADKAL